MYRFAGSAIGVGTGALSGPGPCSARSDALSAPALCACLRSGPNEFETHRTTAQGPTALSTTSLTTIRIVPPPSSTIRTTTRSDCSEKSIHRNLAPVVPPCRSCCACWGASQTGAREGHSGLEPILRLRRQQGLSVRETARALGVSVGVVSKMASRAEKAGVTWAVAENTSDAALGERLYGGPRARATTRPRPDPVYLHAEARRPGVTLEVLHLEHLRPAPDRASLHRAWPHLSAMAGDGKRSDAPGAQGRREVLCRLRGEEGEHRRSDDGSALGG